MQTLSNNLKKLRSRIGASQQAIADTIGVKKNTYEAWENRNIEPSIDKLIALANLYNISVDELINDDPICKADSLSIRYAVASEHIKKAIASLLKL